MTVSLNSNPYAPPSSVLEKNSPPVTRRRSGWLIGLCLLQCVIIVVAVAAEVYRITTILASGPVFAISGLVLLMVASVRRDVPMSVFAGSAPLFATVLFVLINFMGWGPSEATGPVTTLSFAYALIALPVAVWLLVVRSIPSEITREEP